eukprot:scaffold8711_cov30-Prasinocladus_malaysianus.AAC.1
MKHHAQRTPSFPIKKAYDVHGRPCLLIPIFSWPVFTQKRDLLDLGDIDMTLELAGAERSIPLQDAWKNGCQSWMVTRGRPSGAAAEDHPLRRHSECRTST